MVKTTGREKVMEKGAIKQVMGPVVDVEFAPGCLPPILSALTTSNPSISDKEDNLVLEVAQHLGDGVVRAVAMDTSEGLTRGQEVRPTGESIQVPVGQKFWVESLMWWESPWMVRVPLTQRRNGPFIERLLLLKSKAPKRKC